MRRLKILAKPLPIVQTQQRQFNTSRLGDNAKLTISPLGEYKLVVNSYDYEFVAEERTKSDSIYKKNLAEMSLNIKQAYDNLTDSFSAIHKKSINISDSCTSYSIQKEIDNVDQKYYIRKQLSLHKPIDVEVRALLSYEANCIFHGKNDCNREKKQYVDSKWQDVLTDRLNKWKEIKDFYDDIELAHEKIENLKFEQEYQTEIKYLKSRLEGDDVVIDDLFDKLVYNIEIPFNAELHYTYNKEQKSIDSQFILKNNIETLICNKCARIGRGNKVFVDQKAQKQIDQECTECKIGILFYLASYIFNISPNIEHICLALKESNGLIDCWVKFERERFSKLNFSTILPSVNIHDWIHIMNVTIIRGAEKLIPMDENEFLIQKKSMEANFI